MSQYSSGGKVNRLLGQFIIKYHFQFKYSFYVLLLVAGTGLLLWLEARLTISRMLESGMVVNEDAVEQLHLISSIIGKTAFLVSGVAFGAALVMTHFIAGPIYRFEKLFQEIRDGNIGMLARLRSNDNFQETAEALNQALSGLRGKLQKERDATNSVVAEFSKVLEDAGRAADAAQFKKMMADVQSNPQGIRMQIQK